MAAWKSLYLIHGDDHGRIAERRASFRSRAEAESGAGGVEMLEGDRATAELAGLALSAMTFAVGRRFIVIDGAERWKDNDFKTHVAPAIGALDENTTVAFFAREDGRQKVPAGLIKAIEKAGGDVLVHATVKARDLPGWVVTEGRRLGVQLDTAAARALVARVGDRQQRLLRELERLALEHGQGASLGTEEILESAESAELQVWGLVDALVARDRRAALRAHLELRDQGESLARLIPMIARRVREVLAIAERLEAGESPAQVKASMRGGSWIIDRRIKEARATDADALRRALETLAQLEVDTRGLGDLQEDTLAVLAVDQLVSA